MILALATLRSFSKKAKPIPAAQLLPPFFKNLLSQNQRPSTGFRLNLSGLIFSE